MAVVSIFIGSLLWLQNAAPQAATGQPATDSAVGSSAILEMLHNSGPVALVVLGILLITSFYSWAIMLQKWSGFRRARTQSIRFLRAFRKAQRLEEIAAVSEQFKPSPLAMVFDVTYDEYQRQMETQGQFHIASLERSAQTAASESLTLLESRMTWLATIGAVSPFLGLFGTIWGIIDAFHGLGTAGAATLRAVAPGVSEALITTAAGLAVAVPAVVGYNQFTAQLREFAARIDDFARELLNSIEDLGSQYSYQNRTQHLPFPETQQQHPQQAPQGYQSPYLHGSHGNLPRY